MRRAAEGPAGGADRAAAVAGRPRRRERSALWGAKPPQASSAPPWRRRLGGAGRPGSHCACAGGGGGGIMGTAARVVLGLRAPGRPGFPSLGRGTEAWFVSGERWAFSRSEAAGSRRGFRLPSPWSPARRAGPEGSRRVFPGTGALAFSVCHTFFGREPLV